jgi:hypothetical protein
LNSFLVAFKNLRVDIHSIADFKGRDIASQGRLFNQLQDLLTHDLLLAADTTANGADGNRLN